MKICFLGDAQSIHLQRWANYFIKNGHVVHIITMEPNIIKGAEIHNISFLNLKKEIPDIRFVGYLIHKYREYKSILVLKSYLNKIKPDIINSHYMTFYGILGSKLNFHPYVITCWGSDVLIVPNILGKTHMRRMKKAFGKTDLITVVSKYMKEELSKMGIKKTIMVNPFGVDVSKFNPHGKKIGAMKERYGGKKIIISTRNLEPVYDVECLIKAFSLVIKQNKEIILLIKFGGGSLENSLKKLVNNLGMDKYIHFLGKISDEEMPDYLRSADIYVSTSLSDGTSVSLLEAMACGVFPIVTDIPGNRPWIIHGKNGFLFEKGDYYKLSELILKNIRNENMIKNAAKINQEIIYEKGNWEKNSRTLEETYGKIIK